MALTITIAPHPLLDVGVFVQSYARSLAELVTPSRVVALGEPHAEAPFVSSDTVRAEVRALLRQGGFKPAGRSKPASEYLHAAACDGRYPTINAAVDTCNAVSLHSGLPISLVDVDRLAGSLRIEVLAPGTSYIFNPSGQTIDAGGLLCLCDAEGPSGTPVKDAQRTKTHDGTRAAIAIVWGTRSLPNRTAKVTAWYRGLVGEIDGATIEDVATIAG